MNDIKGNMLFLLGMVFVFLSVKIRAIVREDALNPLLKVADKGIPLAPEAHVTEDEFTVNS